MPCQSDRRHLSVHTVNLEFGNMKILFISSLFLFTSVLSTSFGAKPYRIRSVHTDWKDSQAILNFGGNKSLEKEALSTKSLKDEHEENLKKWYMQCFQQTRVSPDLVLKLKTGNWRINDKALKEWVLCLLNKYDLMSMEGVFRLDTAMSLVPRAERAVMEDFIDECLPKIALEPREIAWRYAKCYHLGALDPRNKQMRFHYMTLFY